MLGKSLVVYASKPRPTDPPDCSVHDVQSPSSTACVTAADARAPTVDAIAEWQLPDRA